MLRFGKTQSWIKRMPPSVGWVPWGKHPSRSPRKSWQSTVLWGGGREKEFLSIQESIEQLPIGSCLCAGDLAVDWGTQIWMLSRHCWLDELRSECPLRDRNYIQSWADILAEESRRQQERGLSWHFNWQSQFIDNIWGESTWRSLRP